MKKYFLIHLLLAACMVISIQVLGQQQIKVDVSPAISKAIKGEVMLNRTKYFNLAANSKEVSSKVTDQQMFNRYFNEYEMTVGRSLGMTFSAVKWGNQIREDAARPGYTDTTYLKNQENPNDNGMAAIQSIFGANQNLALHDREGSWPEFMPTYTLSNASGHTFPENNDAYSELAASMLKYSFTDFQRPAFYEPVNEPHWAFWSDQRFLDFHTMINDKVDALGLETQVGGPCLSVGNFYKKEYGSLNQITGFIDKTDFELDFYSFHIYDYMNWSDADNDFIGAVSSGLPEEGVFDAIAAHSVKEYGTEFSFVGSEMGGYIPDTDNRSYALDMLSNKYFPGSGFLHEMEKRSIDNFILVNSAITNTMMFMNHPHIVKKTVPFILLETSGWDPYYYSSLLVKENFDKSSSVFHESKLINFYKFFADVRGRRVASVCNDNDIQHFSFVDENTLSMVFHNQSNQPGIIDIDIDYDKGNVQTLKLRRVGRNIDFRPYFTEQLLDSIGKIEIKDQESLVLFVSYENAIDQEQLIDETPFYSDKVGVKFTGSETFTVAVTEADKVKSASLRVGISRAASYSKEVDISLNGTTLTVPVEDCAGRLTKEQYASARILEIDPTLLKASNEVIVSFPDGKSGGVGAVVIRAGYESSVALEAIQITDSIALYSGDKSQLKVSFMPVTAGTDVITWISRDESIATVTDGMVEGKGVGSTYIVATSATDGFMDSCKVKISDFAYKSYAAKDKMLAIFTDDEQVDKGTTKEMAVDGDLGTFWHTQWIPNQNPLPHEIWVDFGDTIDFNEFIMTPRQDPWGPNGNIGKYELFISNDSADWGEAIVADSFAWDTLLGDSYYKELQTVSLPDTSARFLRLLALSEHQNTPEITTACVAEIDVTTAASGISLQESLSMIVGEQKILGVSVLPLGGMQSGTNFAWKSLNESVAMVSGGNIKAIRKGSAEIVVQTFGSVYSDTCLVTVDQLAYDVKFVVKDKSTQNAIEGATIIFDWQNTLSDAVGEAIFTQQTPLSHEYSITNTNYTTVYNKLDLISDTTITIELDAPSYTVSFVVTDKDSKAAIADADVVLDGETLKTDANGKAEFEKSAGNFDYTVNATDYNAATGNVDVSEDVEVAVNLEKTVGIGQTSSNALQLFPNPAGDYVRLQSETKGKLVLINLEGKILIETKVNDGENTLDLSKIQSGNYIVKLINDNETKTGFLNIVK